MVAQSATKGFQLLGLPVLTPCSANMEVPVYDFQPIYMSGTLLMFINGKLFLISHRLMHKISNADSENVI